MPSGFSVVDDPALTQLGGVPLLGHYATDDEGIAAEKVTLIEDGKLRGFLMSRTPRRGVDHSNGHGRSGLVGWAHGYPGNLLISKKAGLSSVALRAELLAVVREQDAPYGLVITELKPRTSASNGDTVPSPEMAYEVTRDGKQTLVRGAQLSSLSVRDLRDILAAGRESAVYSFVSESDEGLDTAVSVAAPALLFEDLDVRAATSPNARPPVVSRPTADVK
jgi:predicted Zn-dependent protease